MPHHAQLGGLLSRWTFMIFAAAILFAFGCSGDSSGPNENGATSVSDQSAVGGDEAEVPAAAVPFGLLVTVEELEGRLVDETVRILDVRSAAEYDAGHIPGAVRVDVNEWRARALAGNGAGLHDADAWADVVGALGIDALTNVVVYSTNPTSAARIWWTLKYLGVENAAILDGGWDFWVAQDAPVSTEPAIVPPVSFEPAFQTDRLAEIGDLKKSYAAEDVVVVDARSEGEFRGSGEGRGRIPGAAHLEWSELLTEEGRYKSKAELKKLFAEHGLSADKTTVTHCQTGGRASVNAFALELVGRKNVKNYYCGWSQWSKDAEAPIEQGDPDNP